MYYSYAMGMNEEMYELEKEGFIIEKDDNDFMITFNKDMANKWEDFVYKHLKVEFWN